MVMLAAGNWVLELVGTCSILTFSNLVICNSAYLLFWSSQSPNELPKLHPCLSKYCSCNMLSALVSVCTFNLFL